MAFVSNMQDDEENQPGQTASSGPVSPSGGGSAVHLAPTSGVGATGASAGAPNANGTPAAGGSFATLDKYVGANQGQATGLANNITKGIGDQYNSLNSGNQSTLSGIQNNVNSASTPQDTGVLSAEAADPVSFASNPSNISSFQKQLNDQYTGPTSAEGDAGYQQQQSAINNAISQGNASTQTAAGRDQLLQQTEAAPTAGVTGLNSAILSQDPNAQSKIENAYQPFSNLLTGLSAGAQGVDQNIAQAKSGAAATSAAANAQIASQGQGLQTNLQNEVTKDQADENAYNASVNASNTNLAGFNPIATDINTYDTSYGITPFSGLSQYLASPTALYNNVPTINSAATTQDVATNNALSELGGSNYNSPITDPTQAGKFAIPTLNAVAPVGNAAGLEYSALVPATQETFTNQFGTTNANAKTTDPGEQSYQLSGAGATQGGAAAYGNAQTVAFQNLLKQLSGFNNGVVSPALGGFGNMYTEHDQ